MSAANNLPRPNPQQQQQHHSKSRKRQHHDADMSISQSAARVTHGATGSVDDYSAWDDDDASMDSQQSKRRRRDDSSSSHDIPAYFQHHKAAPPPQRQQQQRAEDDSTDDDNSYISIHEEEAQMYMSLGAAAERSINKYMDRELSKSNKHNDCFICNFQVRYEKEVQRRGGRGRVKREDLYAYALLIDSYYKSAFLPVRLRARKLCTLYRNHIYRPAVEKLGGRAPDPKILPKPSARVFLEHMTLFTNDPVAKRLMILRKMEELMHAASDRALVDGTFEPVAVRYFFSASKELWAMWKDFERMAGGAVIGPMALDIRKVQEFAGPGPLEEMEERNNNLLGGASATDHDLVVSRVTAQRPVMGDVELRVESVDSSDDMDISDSSDDNEL